MIAAFVLFPAYDRTRDIIFESQIFEEFPHSHFKATMLSLLNFSSLLNSLWAPLLLAFFVAQTDIQNGYVFFGVAVLLILAPVFWLHRAAEGHSSARIGHEHYS